MSNVKLKRNKEEKILAKALWHRGYRYRLNDRNLPGSPDIALSRYNIAIFVDGEFWHGKDFKINMNQTKSNQEYWHAKILENINRDKRNDNLLRQIGWIPLHFWTSDIIKNLKYCIQEIEEFVEKQSSGMSKD
ncbi:very short patch repair endonuclease [Faecalitalea cylindroides]|uniref:very short patch repair endonuclease n=1 Tax=Faecalitalea cylindroides TaxID=39483 RepID=UPI003F5D5013